MRLMATFLTLWLEKEHVVAYTVFAHAPGYGARDGLEGPFHYPNGQVLYYDPREGEYYDPKTDFYVPREDVARLQQQIFDRISG